MQATKLRPGTRRGGVIWLPVDELEPSPMQPRKNFPDGELQELSESIAQYSSAQWSPGSVALYVSDALVASILINSLRRR